ncbi:MULTISPECIES: hypothetical protein [Streptomyces]|uniref:hypothetical protein n=1 Tax=Streptomyces TaxID=1883 RepID=UPI00339DAB53
MSPNQKKLIAAFVALVISVALGALFALAFALIDEEHDDWAVLAVFGGGVGTLLLISAAWVAMFHFSDSRPQPPAVGQAPPSNSPGTPVS